MCFWFIPKKAWTASSWTGALVAFVSLQPCKMEILVIHQLNIHMLQSLPFSPGQKWSQTNSVKNRNFQMTIEHAVERVSIFILWKKGFFWSSWGRMKQIFALPMWKELPYWANIIATSVRWMVDDSDVSSRFSFSFSRPPWVLVFSQAPLFVSNCFHTIQLACI